MNDNRVYRHFCNIGVLCCVLLACSFGPDTATAEVVRTQIDYRRPFADGHQFGRTGAYEIIAGRLFYEVSPEHSANARITDLKRAPRNERGKVEFWSDFFVLTPADPTNSNGRLIYDVHNRGNKLALWTFNDGLRTNEPATLEHAGNGFLLRAGYTILWTGWTGWNGDVAADGTGRLLAGLPVAVHEDGTPITARNYVEISVDERTYRIGREHRLQEADVAIRVGLSNLLQFRTAE